MKKNKLFFITIISAILLNQKDNNSLDNNNIVKTSENEITNEVITNDDLFLKKHHLSNGTFKNPEGTSDQLIDKGGNRFDYFLFLKEKNKLLKKGIPQNHVLSKEKALKQFNTTNGNKITWLGHASFLITINGINIITDPVLTNKTGPLIFGSKRYVDMPITLKDIVKKNKIDLILITHSHYDHLDLTSIKQIIRSNNNVKIITPLNNSRILKNLLFHNLNITELDWYQDFIFENLKIKCLPAIHWSQRSLFDLNKSLWGSFLIEYDSKKMLFCCDTGYDELFYKKLGNTFGPIDILFVNIGAYYFKPLFDKSNVHATPEEALNLAKDFKAKKTIGMHWGTFVLSLEDFMDPKNRFLNSNSDYDVKKRIIFDIGETKDFNF